MALIKLNTRSLPDNAVTPAKISQNLGRRNMIINGAMNVAQRGTSFSGTSGGDESQFVVDRWRYGHKTGTVTLTQNGVSDLVGFQNSVKIQVTGTGTAATGNQDLFETKIEGQDLVSAGWGLSNAKDLTLSFYYKSNSTDNRVAWFYSPERGRDLAVIFAASALNTWERITINIPADQAFDNNSNSGLYIRFILSAGSQFTSGLASTWGAIGNDRYGGVANFHSSTSNYAEFTGAQLEVGDTATPFEHRTYAEELTLCQRYFFTPAPRSFQHGYIGPITSASSSVAISLITYPVAMRSAPSLEITNPSDDTYRYRSNNGSINGNSNTNPAIGNTTKYNCRLDWTGFSGLTANTSGIVTQGNGTDGYFGFTAEL
jgi:hypothetical protein